MTDTTKRSRRTLLVLLALFFAPLAASFILYYGFDWRPAGGSNHGELLQPLRQLPGNAAPLLGKWALVYVGDGRCDADCRRALVFARQTRLSLNKDMTRVNWSFMAISQCCDREYLDRDHAGLQLLDVSDSQASDALRAVLPAAQDGLRHALFIIDPRGNIVMRYDVRDSPRGLLDDMKKLLKLSHIG
jgi:hypothetical protein